MPEPAISDRYPWREALSPPFIDPVNSCAEVVHVSGFVAHATVRVFAGGGELLAEAEPDFGFADLPLNRPVEAGEMLTATQTINGVDSQESWPPREVATLPADLIARTKPLVVAPIFACGHVVPVANTISGCTIHLTQDGTEIAAQPAVNGVTNVIVAGLTEGAQVRAHQIGCERSPNPAHGPESDPLTVFASPAPTPPPRVLPESLVQGNDAVSLADLFVGAECAVFVAGAQVGGGGATAASNWVPLSVRLGSDPVTATQALCAGPSPESPPETPSAQLRQPRVIGPICDGARHVVVRDTLVNATVMVFRNGSPVGVGGAALGDAILQLGGGQSLSAGDRVTAIQYLPTVFSPMSDPVTVVGRLEKPSIEILGGRPELVAVGEEQPIDGPVFPRGAGPGPLLHVQTCCDKDAEVRILDLDGNEIAKPPLVQLFPGYFTAYWPWTSSSGWAVPDGIPVGRYTVEASSPCTPSDATAPFFIIFDPGAVGGPPRFSFDKTAVWFGAVHDGVTALHYYLHLSDRRVFDKAMGAVSGMTDAFAAADAIARAEEGMFSYSLNYHTQDIVDLIENSSEAQCADDACTLTALLRAIGIPAHPVTADAALETGDANWTFDTWVEFLATDGGATEWRIFHPHEYPGEPARSRSDFGLHKGVAVKSFNDIIVMAGTSWPPGALDDGSADVTYARQGCGEPQQDLNKASWIDELCEAGYWNEPHWECLHDTTNRVAGSTGFRFDADSLRFGGVARGSVGVVNDSAERQFGTFTIDVIAYRPESKRVAEVTHAETHAALAADPGDRLTIPFALDLPPTVAPGEQLMIRARLDGRTAVMRPLRLPVAVAAELDVNLEDLREGDERELRLRVTNSSDAVVHDVAAALAVPFAVTLADRGGRRALGDLQPGEEREVSWTFRAAAPLDSGSLHVDVATADGGSHRLRRPFRIAPSAAAQEASAVVATP